MKSSAGCAEGEQLHGDVHGHVLDLVNQQCHCNEEERHNQAGERQRVGLGQESEASGSR